MRIYVGYDDREDLAYRVCVHSLLRHARDPVTITPLKHKELRDRGLFTRPWRVTETGQMVDERDGQPFSTQFSHSRFLVPELARREGLSGWAMFVDCDFLFLGDVSELFRLCESDKAVMVVKHNYRPTAPVKMDGMAQVPYARKLWSSLMLFNLRHSGVRDLDPYFVNTTTGSLLHNFGWLLDEEIGELPEEWNWIPGHSPHTCLSETYLPKAIHYTDGAPWFGKACELDYLWHDAVRSMK